MSDISSVDRLYKDVRRLASTYEIKPEERVNEVVMAKMLGASRTPLREALNRLVSEGFLTFQKGKGFFCRPLNPSQIFELYEARAAIECETMRLACERASDEDIEGLKSFLEETAPKYVVSSEAEILVALDEQFHMAIAKFSRNQELLRMLENINHRIRYVRTVDLDTKRTSVPVGTINYDAHNLLVEALASRDSGDAVKAMRNHLSKFREDVTESVRKAFAQIYVPE